MGKIPKPKSRGRKFREGRFQTQIGGRNKEINN
jgi:hypothetical protein